MKPQKIFKKLLFVLMACIMVCTPVLDVSAATSYSTENMFQDTSIKGMQGAESSSLYGGLDHTLVNVFLDDTIKAPDSQWATRGWIAPYIFEGEAFYFKEPDGIGFVELANRKDMSISVVFLLRKTVDRYGADSSFLIDPASNEGGHNYYAPNTDLSTYGGRAVRAYWHYLMDSLTEEGWHIDNFILGNEVNMPNHWHYSGGVSDQDAAYKYADAFYYMWSAVREHTNVSRCSVSIDHSWQHNDEGRGIAAKNFLHMFHDRLSQHQSGVDWCVSAHLYPAILYDTRIWEDSYGLTPMSPDAQMVDGSNLSVMTNYIRDTWGENHRVMLTEQGFSDQYGAQAQAACLAYTYYAAMYDPMVDAFLINVENAGTAADGESLNFAISGTLAAEVYTKIGNGNATDEQWIADVCLPLIGVDSWAEIVPNYGQEVDKDTEVEPIKPELGPEEIAQIQAFVTRMYQQCLSRDPDQAGLDGWVGQLSGGYMDGSDIAEQFVFSNEMLTKNLSDAEFVKVLYRSMMGREADQAGLDGWVGQLQGGYMTRSEVTKSFVESEEFTDICGGYGISTGSYDASQAPIEHFVTRFYTLCLERKPDQVGLYGWVGQLKGQYMNGAAIAEQFFFSNELVNRNLSNEKYIELLYNTLMGRPSDAAGKSGWLTEVENGRMNRRDLLKAFIESNEFTEICTNYGIIRGTVE